jgi:hypothetical protein
MNFLKKIGLVLVKGAEAAGQLLGFGPVISMVLGFLPKGLQGVASTGVSDLTLIAKEIITAEKMFAAVSDPNAKTGSQKLIAAAPGVSLILDQWAQSGVLGSVKVKDKAKADAAVKTITSGLADYLSACGD